MAPRRVVFVCSGNTCRSPLAEVLARDLLARAGLTEIGVTSAGLHARPGNPAAHEAQSAAARAGLTLAAHEARPLGDLPLDDGTLVLAMTPEQAASIRTGLVAASMLPLDVHALLPYARERGARLPIGDAVEDPFGGGPLTYDEVVRTLHAALEAIVAAWSLDRDRNAPSAPLDTKTLALPRLAGLRPTLESTALKLQEEAGELAEAIGKYRALSGERAQESKAPVEVMTAIGGELLDVAQTAVTMMFVLEDQYGVSLDGLMRDHVRKLASKGYLGTLPVVVAGEAMGAG